MTLIEIKDILSEYADNKNIVFAVIGNSDPNSTERYCIMGGDRVQIARSLAAMLMDEEAFNVAECAAIMHSQLKRDIADSQARLN